MVSRIDSISMQSCGPASKQAADPLAVDCSPISRQALAGAARLDTATLGLLTEQQLRLIQIRYRIDVQLASAKIHRCCLAQQIPRTRIAAQRKQLRK
jgi:hypothetical protein